MFLVLSLPNVLHRMLPQDILHEYPPTWSLLIVVGLRVYTPYMLQWESKDGKPVEAVIGSR